MKTIVVMVGVALGGVAHADRGEAWHAPTVGVQSLSGVVGGAALGLGGGYALGSGDDGWQQVSGAAAGFLVGMTVGTVAGVQVSGDLMDGTGSLGWTVVGFAGGAVATVGVSVAMNKLGYEDGPLYVVVAGALTTSGAIAGYHLSSDSPGQMNVPLVTGSF